MHFYSPSGLDRSGEQGDQVSLSLSRFGFIYTFQLRFRVHDCTTVATLRARRDLPVCAAIIVWTKKPVELVERTRVATSSRCNLGSQITGVLAVRRIGNADFGIAGLSGLPKLPKLALPSLLTPSGNTLMRAIICPV
ncbi:hypothetical protein [Caballeronia sp. KNU42]|jgi:hypothetical protein